MNSHWRQLWNFCQVSFPEFDVKVFLETKSIQRFSIWPNTKKFLYKIHCLLHMRKADLNLTLVTGMTNGFIFQIINSLIEPWGVCLTYLDCNSSYCFCFVCLTKLISQNRPSNPPCLQLLRTDREGIDDIITHGTWCHLCKRFWLTAIDTIFVDTKCVKKILLTL